MLFRSPEGQRDLYGLCNPCRDSDTHFQYGIGVLADEATDRDALDIGVYENQQGRSY